MKNIAVIILLMLVAMPCFASSFKEAWISADNTIMTISQPDIDPLTYNVLIKPRKGAPLYAGPSMSEDEIGKAEFLGEYKVTEEVKTSEGRWQKVTAQQ
ncbi:MAG: hypothetical protein ABIJ26_05780 [Candidatus Margulisiibacteriota bacterium]